MNEIQWRLNGRTHEQILDASRRHRLEVMYLAWLPRAQNAISTATELKAESTELHAESTRTKAASSRLIDELRHRRAERHEPG